MRIASSVGVARRFVGTVGWRDACVRWDCHFLPRLRIAHLVRIGMGVRFLFMRIRLWIGALFALL